MAEGATREGGRGGEEGVLAAAGKAEARLKDESMGAWMRAKVPTLALMTTSREQQQQQ